MRLVFVQGRYLGMVEAFFTPGKQDRALVKRYAAVLQKRMRSPARPAATKAKRPPPPPASDALAAREPGPDDLPGWVRRCREQKLRYPFDRPQGGVRARAGVYSLWFSQRPTPYGPSRIMLDVLELADAGAARRFWDARLQHWRSSNWKAWPGTVQHSDQGDTASLYGDPKASHARDFVRVGRFVAVAFVIIPQGVNARAANAAVTRALLKHMLAAAGAAPAPPTPPRPPASGRMLGQDLLPTKAELAQWRRTRVKQPSLPQVKGMTPSAGIEAIYRWQAGGNFPALVLKLWSLADEKEAAAYFEEYRWQWAKRPGQARKLKVHGRPGFIHVLLGPLGTTSIGFQAGRYVGLLIAISRQPPLGERYTTGLAQVVVKRLLGRKAASPTPRPAPRPGPPGGPRLELQVRGALLSLAQGQSTALPVEVKNTGGATAKGVELRIWTPQPGRLGFSQSARVKPRAFLVKQVGDIAPGKSVSTGQVMVHALAGSGSAQSVIIVYPGQASARITWQLRPGQAPAEGGGLEVITRTRKLNLVDGEEAALPFVVRNNSGRVIKRMRLFVSSNRAAQVGLVAQAGQMAEPWLERYLDLAPARR